MQTKAGLFPWVHKLLSQYPIHLFLLSPFFISFKYTQYQGLLDKTETLKAAFYILIGLVFVASFYFLLYKQFQKSAIAATVSGLLFLFFGDLRESFQNSEVKLLAVFSEYKFFLLLIFVPFVIFLFLLKKKINALKTTFYLNLVFLIYSSIEIYNEIKLFNSKQQQVTKHIQTVPVSDSVQKNLPDIYYIVPDCYPSTAYQKEMLATDNSGFDSSLAALGFYLVTNSKSNYNRTAFSLLCTFTMSYPPWLANNNSVNAFYYNKAITEISTADAFQIMEANGYSFVNLSLFDFKNTKALKKEKFLSTTTSEMIFKFTFWSYFSSDILASWVFNKADNWKKMMIQTNEPKRAYNKKIIDSLLNGITNQPKPAFVYAHLMMPHAPYFYDSTGKALPNDSIYTKAFYTDRKKFAGYIKYTNQNLLNLIRATQSKTNGKAVIILQSDHGIADLDATRESDAFRNYTAIYYPDSNYSQLYNSMSNVNIFRLVFNKFLRQQLPLLPDNSNYLLLK